MLRIAAKVDKMSAIVANKTSQCVIQNRQIHLHAERLVKSLSRFAQKFCDSLPLLVRTPLCCGPNKLNCEHLGRRQKRSFANRSKATPLALVLYLFKKNVCQTRHVSLVFGLCVQKQPTSLPSLPKALARSKGGCKLSATS